jgi:hypothetical protein
MSTPIICVVLLVIVCIEIRSFIKRTTSGCCGSDVDKKKVTADKDLSHYMYKYIINTVAIHCGHCKQSVENKPNSIGETYAVAYINKNNSVLYSKEDKKYRNECGFTAKEIVLCDEK